MGGLLVRFLRDIARSPLLCVGLTLAILAQAAFQLGSSLVMKFVFDEGITQGNTEILYLSLGVWAGLLVLLGIGTVVQELVNTRLGVHETNRLRHDLFEKIQVLPPDYFVHNSSSDVANVFSTDVAAIETAFVRAFPAFLLYGLVMVLSLVLLFVIEWRLALVTIASLTVVIGLPKIFSNLAEKQNEKYFQVASRISRLVQESTATHVIVRLFALGRKRQDRFSTALNELAQTGTAAHVYVGLIGRSALIGTGFSQLAVIGIGGILAVNGYMTAGLLIAFIGLLLRIGDGVAQLSVSIPQFLPAVAARKRLDVFLAQNVASPENPNAVSVGRLEGEIVFDDVVFGYDPANPILKNVSFSIRAGEAVAFVGPSGSGKSTVISLLLRVRRPDGGKILFDGHSLGDIAENSLRDNMSVVPQNAILFEASVRDNILVGRPEATEEDIIEAARAAHIHDTVMSKPERYDTIVSVTGGALSGGERQRVATARALLRDAPILLLDEATSALDPASEQVVNQSIARRVGRHTVVSVTHRLASITEFDRIFVMDGGRLVESGRHEDLLAQRGLYCDLWEKQNGINLDVESGAPSVSVERLALIPFLSGCSAKTLADLASLFVVEAFREGSDVFRQGDDGDKFYIVARGRLEVRLERPGESVAVVATLIDGDFFGELALVKNQPRAATIHVASDSWCLSLPRQHFLALLKTEDAARASIAAAIAKIDGN